MNKLTLEQRITRLEKIIKNESYVGYDELLEAAQDAVDAVGTDYDDVVDEIYNTYGWEENVDYLKADLTKAILDAGGDEVSGEDLEDNVKFWFENNMSPYDIRSRKMWLKKISSLIARKDHSSIKECAADAGTTDLAAVANILSSIAQEYKQKYDEYMEYGWDDRSSGLRFAGAWRD